MSLSAFLTSFTGSMRGLDRFLSVPVMIHHTSVLTRFLFPATSLAILPFISLFFTASPAQADTSSCHGLLSLGLHNVTQRTDDTQANALVIADFCARDFSQINDADVDSNTQAQLIKASYSVLTGGFSPTATTADIRNSIQAKQKESCTSGYSSPEYLKNTSDSAKNVYRSALEVWRRCNDINAAGLQVKVTSPTNLQSITVDLSTKLISNGLALVGVTQSGGNALCNATLPPRNANSRTANVITVDATTYIPFNTPSNLSVTCKRDLLDDSAGGKYAEETSLTLKTNAGSLDMTMAAIGKVPRVEYDRAVADVKGLVIPINGSIAGIQTNISTLTSALDTKATASDVSTNYSTLINALTGLKDQLGTVSSNVSQVVTNTQSPAPNPWVLCGKLSALDKCSLPDKPLDKYEYGISYNAPEPLPIVCSQWNKGVRIYNKQPYFVDSDNPQNGMGYGGFLFYKGTLATDECPTAGQFRHTYWRLISNNVVQSLWSNGCMDREIYCRIR